MINVSSSLLISRRVYTFSTVNLYWPWQLLPFKFQLIAYRLTTSKQNKLYVGLCAANTRGWQYLFLCWVNAADDGLALKQHSPHVSQQLESLPGCNNSIISDVVKTTYISTSRQCWNNYHATWQFVTRIPSTKLLTANIQDIIASPIKMIKKHNKLKTGYIYHVYSGL